MKKKKKIELHLGAGGTGVAYVALPAHPGMGTPGVTGKQVRLRDLIPDYKGADLYIDFDKNGEVIGVEILV